MDWEVVDEHGHWHTFDDDGELPTLVEEILPVPCDGSCGGLRGCEGYDMAVYYCQACGIQIEPRFVPDEVARGDGVPVPGLQEWTAVVEGEDPIRPTDIWPSRRIQVATRGVNPMRFGVGLVGDLETGQDGWKATILGIGPLGKRTFQHVR
jgi:hypothetical protein